MASVKQRVGKNGKKAKRFTAYYHNSNGKLIVKVTKMTNEKDAQKVADDWEALAKGAATVDHLHRINYEMAKLVTDRPEARASTTVSKYIDQYLKGRRLELGLSTYYSKKIRARKFLEFLKTVGKADSAMGNITKADILAFRAAESERVQRGTVNMSMEFVRALFEHAKSVDKIMHENPTDNVADVKMSVTKAIKTEERRAFTDAELSAVFKAAKGEWKSMIIFAVWTGQRLADLARITWGRIDMTNREAMYVTGKSGFKKKIPVPVMPQLYNHILKLREAAGGKPSPDAFVHPEMESWLHRNQLGNAAQLSQQFTNLLADAGIRERAYYRHNRIKDGPTRPGDTRRTHALVFHSLRHTTATLLYQAGVDLRAIGDILGHNSVEMTRLYAHVQREKSRTVMLNMPNFTAFEDDILPPEPSPSNVVPIDSTHAPTDTTERQPVADAEKNRHVA